MISQVFIKNNPDRIDEIDKKVKGFRAGRPKGAINKYSKLRHSMLKVYKKLGGDQELLKWAEKEKNRDKFYTWLIDLIPKQQEVSVTGQIEHELAMESIGTFFQFALAAKQANTIYSGMPQLDNGSNMQVIDNAKLASENDLTECLLSEKDYVNVQDHAQDRQEDPPLSENKGLQSPE